MSDKLEKINKNLSKNLPAKKTITKDDLEIKDDYEFSRKTYKDLIRTGYQGAPVRQITFQTTSR